MPVGRYAILIVTYTSAEQTKMLVDSLNNGQFDFYIHLDKKVDIQTHKDLFAYPNVQFVKERIDVKWAGYSLVEAIMNGIRHIAATKRPYDYISLLSGQDYPIKSAKYIADFFDKNYGKEFILYQYFDDWAEAKQRVERYHFTDQTFKLRYIAEMLVNLVTPKRKFPLNVRLCGKETFWSLSPDCANLVVDVIDNNKDLSRFLRYCWGVDEFIFQTIIMSSRFAENVVNDHCRYILWEPKAVHPNILTVKDFDGIMAADGLFARKFDIRQDKAVLQMLDKVNGTGRV
jgi:Core-2/I-Branching enzyme